MKPTDQQMKPGGQHGLTLVESTIALAALGILAVVALMAF